MSARVRSVAPRVGGPRALATAELRWRTLYPRPDGEWPAVLEDDRGGTRYGLYDPLERRVCPVAPARDPELVGLADALARGELVSYRVGRRAIVRSRDGAEHVKVVPPRKARRLLRLAELVAGLDLSAAPAPRVPRLAAANRQRGVLVFATLPGRPLRDALGSPGAPDAIREVAGALADFHAAPVPAGGLSPRSAVGLPEWLSLVGAHAPHLSERYADALAALPARPAAARVAVAHGDLHDGNVLVGGRVALLDLDSLHAGDAAEDVGNLAAHLVLRAMQRGEPPAAGWDQAAALVAAYRSAGGDADEDDVRAFTARTLFRLAAVYLFRRAWQRLTPSLLGEAARAQGLAVAPRP